MDEWMCYSYWPIKGTMYLEKKKGNNLRYFTEAMQATIMTHTCAAELSSWDGYVV